MADRNKDWYRRKLLEILSDGDVIAIVRVAGGTTWKQYEIIVAPEKGKPQFITSWVCNVLGYRRGGRDRNGGMKYQHSPSQLALHLSETLDIKLDFCAY